MKWFQPQFTDIKAAFLQGEPLDREVLVEPPSDIKKPNVLWSLRVCLYGLVDAPRRWFLKVESVLKNTGCIQSKLNPALFVYHKYGKLSGLIIVHVDDFLHAGDEYFQVDVVNKLRTSFAAGAIEESSFRYTGLNIITLNDGITMDQLHYIEKLECIPVSSARTREHMDSLSQIERKQYRALVGSINWAAQQTRPDLAFDIMEMSIKFKDPLVSDLMRANKCIKRLKMEDVSIKFGRLIDNLDNVSIMTWSDAAFANLLDRVSSGAGHVILLVDTNKKCCPLAWTANKVKRVVKSTVAAEALALEASISHAIYLRALLKEILCCRDQDLPIVSWVDSGNLVEALHSSKEVDDKMLRIKIAIIKETIHTSGIQVYHTSSLTNIANPLTKKGASCRDLLHIMKTGSLLPGVGDLPQC